VQGAGLFVVVERAISLNRPLRTRTVGGVGARGEKPLATRFGSGPDAAPWLRSSVPEARLATLMRDGKDTHNLWAEAVNDAVWEPTKWKAPNVAAPNSAKTWLLAQQPCRPLELRDERVPKLCIGFASVEQSTFDEFLFCLRRKRDLH